MNSQIVTVTVRVGDILQYFEPFRRKANDFTFLIVKNIRLEAKRSLRSLLHEIEAEKFQKCQDKLDINPFVYFAFFECVHVTTLTTATIAVRLNSFLNSDYMSATLDDTFDEIQIKSSELIGSNLKLVS